MKFSIVTISFNQAEFLERTIRSVISQEDVEVEYIIVDPGSTDGSREIIERYRKYFAHVIFEKDNGPADGLNKGFSVATGDWFGYINSDDFYLPQGLSKAAQVATRWPAAGALVGNGYIVDQDDRRIRRSFSKRVSRNALRYGGAFALQQATFYKASAFRAVGAFKTGNRTCWDSEILADMVLAGYSIRNINADIGAFRIHSMSITGSGRLVQEYQGDVRRIRAMAFGRVPSYFEERVIGPCYRVAGYLRSPAKTAALIADRVAQKLKT